MINIYQNLTVTDLHDWAVNQTFLKIDFSLVMPHLEYDVHKCSPNLVANINNAEQILVTRLVTSLPHLLYEQQLWWIGVGEFELT